VEGKRFVALGFLRNHWCCLLHLMMISHRHYLHNQSIDCYGEAMMPENTMYTIKAFYIIIRS